MASCAPRPSGNLDSARRKVLIGSGAPRLRGLSHPCAMPTRGRPASPTAMLAAKLLNPMHRFMPHACRPAARAAFRWALSHFACLAPISRLIRHWPQLVTKCCAPIATTCCYFSYVADTPALRTRILPDVMCSSMNPALWTTRTGGASARHFAASKCSVARCSAHKPRLWPRGVVANPRDTTRYRYGLRLATGPNPSVFLSASQHATLH